MTADVRVGTRIVRHVAVLTSAPLTVAVLVKLAAGGPVPPQAWVSIVFSLAIAWLLVRGSEWARGWIITGLALCGIGVVIQLAVGREQVGTGGAIALVLIGAAYFVGVWLLGWSPAVQAYFDRENQGAALNLNSQGGA
jgi:hypothetical protein